MTMFWCCIYVADWRIEIKSAAITFYVCAINIAQPFIRVAYKTLIMFIKQSSSLDLSTFFKVIVIIIIAAFLLRLIYSSSITLRRLGRDSVRKDSPVWNLYWVQFRHVFRYPIQIACGYDYYRGDRWRKEGEKVEASLHSLSLREVFEECKGQR